jgi:hypothetical protein
MHSEGRFEGVEVQMNKLDNVILRSGPEGRLRPLKAKLGEPLCYGLADVVCASSLISNNHVAGGA